MLASHWWKLIENIESATPYPQWKTQIATPALQEYFAGKSSLDELGKKLSDGWKQVAGG